MDGGTSFYQWFTSSFIPHVQRLREGKDCKDQKAILLFDGHLSHISYKIVKAAMDNKMELIKFPSHLTDRIQPLDKCVYGPVKTNWEADCLWDSSNAETSKFKTNKEPILSAIW